MMRFAGGASGPSQWLLISGPNLLLAFEGQIDSLRRRSPTRAIAFPTAISFAQFRRVAHHFHIVALGARAQMKLLNWAELSRWFGVGERDVQRRVRFQETPTTKLGPWRRKRAPRSASLLFGVNLVVSVNLLVSISTLINDSCFCCR